MKRDEEEEYLALRTGAPGDSATKRLIFGGSVVRLCN